MYLFDACDVFGSGSLKVYGLHYLMMPISVVIVVVVSKEGFRILEDIELVLFVNIMNLLRTFIHSFGFFCNRAKFKTPLGVELLVFRGMGSCGWQIFLMVFISMATSCELWRSEWNISLSTE